jgi:hypothetical protein
MTIDDFEWVEDGFDSHLLIHKTREMVIASIKNFSGWYVLALKPPRGAEKIAEHIDNLEAAKVIAMIHVNQNMEGYPNANTYRTRAIPAGPQKIPRGVFKVD